LARETDSIDRRRRVLHLTRTGKHLARKLESATAATENALLERLGPSEYASLREKLLPIIRAESADR
jgi:DNA-binding MarR family transcriptional regulator